ncbi:malto-oligosyltrehalose trehalohydrolase [Angustibacter sp. Root456]|uniref:malto-oligosyltrehalose trehalohydrolase n=1 Tax=Angustibacter sp. Root456 TaxID=1736539 RepID=UPI0006FD7251|nr:malto-oligosyltrehalose trehalohydrolase [Angustibacter sp. Root456]KQX66767.1 malto-oligosyltrehalose trehalohydrolase [Angustibacter sp. Root456]
MHRFAVWAPGAEQVDLVTSPGPDEVRQPMVRSEGGWWRDDGPWAEHGTDYGYCVDGGPLTPDPRSAWQPVGVHGPSRVFDPERFEWHDDGWRGAHGGVGALGAVIYELHVGTFTHEGTLDAAIPRLDDLAALGVDVVELMPVAAFEGRWGWGYDGVHPYAVHEPYGGPEALQRFIDAAHQRGLGVALDVVYNHLGPSGNYLARFGPYFTDDHHTPWGQALNLDGAGNLAVRRWMLDNALRWFRDFHVDALRLDAVHELKDDSPTHVLAQLADETLILSRALERPLDLIAESDLNDPRMVESSQADGMGMDAQWSDDLHHALHAALTGERQGYYADFGSLAVVRQCLTRVFRHDGGWSSFRGSDWGRPVDPDTHDGRRFLGYLQTHDQVGNRALGDRIGALLTPGQQAIGAALVMTSAFTPMVFMGEEWAASTPWQYFTDFSDPDLAAAVRNGRRQEFAEHGWNADEVPDPQDPATRETSVLRWDERRDGDHARMLAWYHDLIALRRKEKVLTNGCLREVLVDSDEDAEWLVVRRGDLRVVANLAEQPQAVPLDGEPIDVVLAWDPAATSLRDAAVDLGAHGVAVVRVARS